MIARTYKTNNSYSDSKLGNSRSTEQFSNFQRPSTSIKKKFSLKRQKVIKEYIKRQNITIAREIPYPSLGRMKKSGSQYNSSNLLDHTVDIKKLELKHEKEGVMRRNKLLLEQILNERLGDCIHNAI
mmetsp:Transcript_10138/g.11392  ORF Transcript_10138/g.11392 Transcript_10138/m.11392 type:complete len:127 (-) Transcript_10138:60-440(-)